MLISILRMLVQQTSTQIQKFTFTCSAALSVNGLRLRPKKEKFFQQAKQHQLATI